jgi:uncharacterized membrane protein
MVMFLTYLLIDAFCIHVHIYVLFLEFIAWKTRETPTQRSVTSGIMKHLIILNVKGTNYNKSWNANVALIGGNEKCVQNLNENVN